MALIHATCVAIDGAGVLLRGASGAGKSDLALRLIDAGAALVADDYCEAAPTGGELRVAAPPEIAGKLEVRGFGIVKLAPLSRASLRLVVDLGPENEIERLPTKTTCEIEGVTLPWMAVDPFTASAAAKVRLALRAVLEQRRLAP